MDQAEIVSAVTQFSSIGFAVWYAWWTTTHTIPRMQDTYDETIKKLVSDFRSDIKEQRAEYMTQIDLMHGSITKMTDVIGELHDAIKGLRV